MFRKYKIGETAKKIGISVRSLRHLDSCDILKPSYRESNGNRFYSDQDIETLSYINLLQLAGFTLKEIPELLRKKDISRDFAAHSQMLRNKGKYFQLLGEYLEKSSSKLKRDNAIEALEIFRTHLSEMSESFHSSDDAKASSEEEQHQELLLLLRKFSEPTKSGIVDYKRLIERIPPLINETYFESFMLMIRVHKSNAFKLDELDQIEKNFIKIRKALESDIM